MQLTSIPFLLFFLVVTILYFLIPSKLENITLLLASYLFYCSWDIRFLIVLLIITLASYFIANYISKMQSSVWQSRYRKKKQKKMLALGCIGILIILAFFKYIGFFIDYTNAFLRDVGIQKIPLRILFPVGVSFYSLEAIGYIIDVYHKRIDVEKNFIDYALFLAFFPKVISGPITRAPHFLVQLKKPRAFKLDNLQEGTLKIIWGFFLKLVIADRISVFVNQIYSNYTDYSGAYVLLAAFLYAFQIYCDFAGYSSIAIGVSKVLGIELIENFNLPYFSKSVREFWHRWHISLSTWLRDYVYFPLGGSHCSNLRHLLNIVLVFLVSGLWHGSSLNFIVWGLLHGLYQVIEILLDKIYKKQNRVIKYGIGHCVITFILVDFAWFFFRVESIHTACDMIRYTINNFHWSSLFDESLFQVGINHRVFFVLIISLGIMFFVDYYKYSGKNPIQWFKRQNIIVKDLIIIIAVISIATLGVWGNNYNAANFIYTQF